MEKTPTITEAAILAKLVGLGPADLTPEMARGLLRLRFDRDSMRTIRKLLRENNRGTITAEDRLILEKYLHVGQLVDLIQARARLSLHDHATAS